ncbi:MAG: phage protease [Verrucomicrobiota bacterium]
MKFQLANPDGWFEALRVGTFPNETEDAAGKKVYVAQVVRPETLNLLVSNWRKMGSPELLIDRDHHSGDKDKTTDAMGWLTDLRVENDRLLARAKWSEDGERMLTGGAYRYCSVVLDTDYEAGQPESAGASRGNRARVTPLYLSSVALTNIPAIGGLKPISNRAPSPAPITEKPTAETMDLSKLATELKLPAATTLEDITVEVIRVNNRLAAADKATTDETLTRLKNRIPAGQEQFFRDGLTANRAPTLALLESLPEQGAQEPAPTARVHNRGTAGAKTAPPGIKEGEGDAPDMKAQQDKHLLELRNRMPSAKRADLVLQAMAEKPEIWAA